jgi:hypothetical protein
VLGIGADDAALGSAQRSTSLVRIPPALAVDLALLTGALDVDGVDIESTLALLTSDVAAAVSSYVGLSVRVGPPGSQAELTTLAAGADAARIVTSLRIPVPDAPGTPGPSVLIVLYASSPGAFVDMAADLAWLTTRELVEIGLDLDVGEGIHAHSATSLRSRSTVDQAIGVLVGRGSTPGQASAELDSLASDAGGDRLAAAVEILSALSGPGADVAPDAD